MTRPWSGTGPDFSIEWAGAPWTLRVDSDRPGLRGPGGLGPILGLSGVAETGRWDPRALSGASLEGFEIRAGRVEATYAPEGWHGLRVRAAWSPNFDEGMDLEVQLQASSVGELHGVEIQTITALGPAESDPLRVVTPRDRGSAAASYDGRESGLGRLSTEPIGDDPGLWIVPKSGREGWSFAEMTRPGDWSRRIFEGPLPFRALRQGLFGYDLEKGVVLRAHLRALWAEKSGATATIEGAFRRFLAEPPALGT